MSLKNLVFGFVLFTLCASLMLSFAINLGSEYDREAEDIGGGAFNLSAFEESSEAVNSSASGYRERFAGGGDGLTDTDNPSGFFSILNSLVSMIKTPFHLISQVAYNVLGFPTLITNVILGLISLFIVFGIWRLIKLGY